MQPETESEHEPIVESTVAQEVRSTGEDEDDGDEIVSKEVVTDAMVTGVHMFICDTLGFFFNAPSNVILEYCQETQNVGGATRAGSIRASRPVAVESHSGISAR